MPLEKLHCDKCFIVLLANVVNRADVGVIQGRSGLGFALKASKSLGIAGEIFGKKLKGDEAVEASVFGFVDDAHAAATELLDDAIVRDSQADHCLETALAEAC